MNQLLSMVVIAGTLAVISECQGRDQIGQWWRCPKWIDQAFFLQEGFFVTAYQYA